jgi:hypothetical protein
MHKDIIGELIGWAIWMTGLVVSIATLTGCSGVELGGRLGVYRVDERQESQATHRKPLPWKCYFTGCDDSAQEAIK